MSRPILSIAIQYEEDIVGARQRARQISALLGFDVQEQTRLATAVSEIARNAYKYATQGVVDFVLEGRTAPQVLLVRVKDAGPGITNLQDILDGRYRSSTGMGLGIAGARRLVDQFRVDSSSHGTTVFLRKILPARAGLVGNAALASLASELVQPTRMTPLDEVREQNRELLRTLDELKLRQDELQRLNAELEDTNRGVVALYAELDEKADHLRRADELKSRFLSNMSHEFRTPLNAIRALTHVLLERMDGALTTEQERQVSYIRKAADELMELVDDLLDLAKVQAGKIVVHPLEFEIANLFGALRGMLRPLLVNESVALIFDDPADLPRLYTDESKVSQILRNLISNALKFTERGEIRVSAWLTADTRVVVFTVTDTGIGIAPEDQDRIFQEFTQLDNPVQKRVRGTGLGLPLSRRLAELLGGTLTVDSTVGVGSTFSARLPVVYQEVSPEPPLPQTDEVARTGQMPVLVVEDSPEEVLLYEKFLRGSGFAVVPASTVQQARQALKRTRPAAIILDILLRGEDAWSFLAELKRSEETRAVPVLVVTSVDDERKGMALGADDYAVKPIERRWLLDRLRAVTTHARIHPVLVVDDDEISRYVLRSLLDDLPCVVAEARDGEEGLHRARGERFDVIFVDLAMPGMTGEELLRRLKADAATRDIPVIVVTSQVLEEEQRRRLAPLTLDVLPKGLARDAAVYAIRAAFQRAGLTDAREMES